MVRGFVQPCGRGSTAVAAPAAHSVLGTFLLPSSAYAEEPIHAEFPNQDPRDVREVVGKAHFDVDRVRELVSARPALARSAWDWGFGDWESALGAASHMGRRDIASVLIEHGARPDVFTAAMMGQLEVVRAFVEAQPGVQRIPGPHGISLLSHARSGGEEAAGVLAYLEDLGDADPRIDTLDLSPEQLGIYAGTYSFEGCGSEPLEVHVDDRGNLRIGRGDRPARFLMAVSEHSFYPSGAEAVRIRFTMDGGSARGLTVHDPDVVIRASRARTG